MNPAPPSGISPALDRLRAMANLLRCTLHASVPYMATRTGMWPLKEGNDTNLLPDMLVFVIHGSIMEIFFFIAGVLSIRQVGKAGVGPFLRNRARKILIPFSVVMLTLVPYVMFLFPIGAELERGAVSWNWRGWAHTAFELWSSNLFPTGHLWFLYYLIFYYGATVLVYGLWRKYGKEVFPALNTIWIWVAMWTVSVACLYFSKAWYILNPLTTAIEWNSFFYFMTFFTVGTLTYYQSELIGYAVRFRYRFLGVFGVMSLVAPVLQQFARQPGHLYFEELHWAAMVAAALHTVSGVGAALGVVYAMQSAPPRWVGLVARSSYWVYLVHLPLVMTMHLLLFPLAWPLIVKFVVALGVSLGVALGGYVVVGRRVLP